MIAALQGKPLVKINKCHFAPKYTYEHSDIATLKGDNGQDLKITGTKRPASTTEAMEGKVNQIPPTKFIKRQQ